MSCISFTLSGSTPANGSSSISIAGFLTSARAISSLRRSPPESVYAGCFATFMRSNGASSSSARARRSFLDIGSVSRIAITLSHTESFLKIDASCAR